MTDLEMTKLCAKAMGICLGGVPNVLDKWTFEFGPGIYRAYDPLHDDAQAMALLWWLAEKGTVTIGICGMTFQDFKNPMFAFHSLDSKETFRRAIVECVAKMEAAK